LKQRERILDRGAVPRISTITTSALWPVYERLYWVTSLKTGVVMMGMN